MSQINTAQLRNAEEAAMPPLMAAVCKCFKPQYIQDVAPQTSRKGKLASNMCQLFRLCLGGFESVKDHQNVRALCKSQQVT